MPSISLPPDSALLARGMTAEVYAWGADKVLKLFLPGAARFSADYEARCSAAIADYDLPLAPFLLGIEIEGRFGLLFKRVSGPSGLELISRKPWLLLPVLHAMARAQTAINASPAPSDIISLHDMLTHHISQQNALAEAEKERILAYLARLPRGNALCHGDLHPGQLIITPDGPIVIDWANTVRGVPAADIARSWLILSMGPPVRQALLGAAVRGILALAARIFVALRLGLGKHETKMAEVKAWLLPLMAARLGENIPGERDRLLRRIRRQLAHAG